jgi:hypothetical protein
MINYLITQHIGIQKIVNKNTLHEIRKIKKYEVGVEIKSISKIFNRCLESTLKIVDIKKKDIIKKSKKGNKVYEYKAEIITEIYWGQTYSR